MWRNNIYYETILKVPGKSLIFNLKAKILTSLEHYDIIHMSLYSLIIREYECTREKFNQLSILLIQLKQWSTQNAMYLFYPEYFQKFNHCKRWAKIHSKLKELSFFKKDFERTETIVFYNCKLLPISKQCSLAAR